MNPLERWFYRRPFLAERAAIALCRPLAERVAGVDWRVLTVAEHSDWKAWRAGGHEGEVPRVKVQTRAPPVPSFRLVFGDDHKAWPKNRCPVCARPCFDGGDWREGAGKPRWNKHWHAPCFHAHAVWRDPTWIARALAERQGGVCTVTGERLLHPEHGTVYGDVQVDHVEPLWRVRLEGARHRWPDVLRFWGPRNLQALSARGHAEKTAREARERARLGRAA